MNPTYPLTSIMVVLVLAYGFTRLCAHWGIITLKNHRKTWNWLLLATFLATGSMGLLAVFKINYKPSIPYYDQLIRWHVLCGIAMAIVATIHLLWHWKYYLHRQPTHPQKCTNQHIDQQTLPSNHFKQLLTLLGFTTMVVQVVFIREFVSVTSGNELVVGVLMSTWLTLTALGAHLGKRCDLQSFSSRRGMHMLTFVGVSAGLMVALLYFLKSQLFPPGSIIGLGSVLVGSLLLLAPVCLISGFLFTALSAMVSATAQQNLIAKAYAYESLGSLIGGVALGVWLGRYFNSMQILGLCVGLALLMGATWTHNVAKPVRIAQLSAALMVPVLLFAFDIDSAVKQSLFPNQQIILNQSSRYGNLVVTQHAGQYNFYENNALQFYTDNTLLNEEAVHFAMCQHPNPQKVLLLSGGISGMTDEIKKYPIRRITYLESNPDILQQWQQLSPLRSADTSIRFVAQDIRAFLRRDKTVYDVVLINLPPPTSLGGNRFFTDEFFRDIKAHCGRQSVASIYLPSTANYADTNSLQCHASLWRTLRRHFSNTLLLTGEMDYFVASDSPLSDHITQLIDQKKIATTAVNAYYIDDGLLAQRSRDLVARFDVLAPVNTDFRPILFIKQIDYWLSHFGISYLVVALLPMGLAVVLFFGTGTVSKGLFCAGFTASSLEIVLMLAFQVYFGSLYLATATFFALFMGGLAAGSYWGGRLIKHPTTHTFALLLTALGLFAGAVPAMVLLAGTLTQYDTIAQTTLYFTLLTLSFSIGLIFHVAAWLQQGAIAVVSAKNYGIDLIGSALGAFLVTLVLLPLWGATVTCVAIGGLNLWGSLFLWQKKTP